MSRRRSIVKLNAALAIEATEGRGFSQSLELPEQDVFNGAAATFVSFQKGYFDLRFAPEHSNRIEFN